MRWVTVLLAMCGAAQAQQVTDGSGAGVEPSLLSMVAAQIGGEGIDPAAIQLDRLTDTTNAEGDAVICGFANVPDAGGFYRGAAPFYYEVANDFGAIFDPDPDGSVLEIQVATADFEQSGCADALIPARL